MTLYLSSHFSYLSAASVKFLKPVEEVTLEVSYSAMALCGVVVVCLFALISIAFKLIRPTKSVFSEVVE